MRSSKITFEPVGDDLYNVIYPGRLTRVDENLTKSELRQIIEQEPYNFSARQELADILIEGGDLDAACEIRHEGCMIALAALPENSDESQDIEELEDIEIAWDNSEGNRHFVAIIAASATDHYMFGDFELAAVFFETAFTLDTEDHLDVTPQMLCSFAALGEWEAYDLYKINLAPKSLTSHFVSAFADYLRLEGSQRDKALATAQENLSELAAELQDDEHSTNDRFLDDIESKRPSRRAQARAIWFAHTPIWSSFPEFVQAITKA